jgi:hypothetical protein
MNSQNARDKYNAEPLHFPRKKKIFQQFFFKEGKIVTEALFNQTQKTIVSPHLQIPDILVYRCRCFSITPCEFSGCQ